MMATPATRLRRAALLEERARSVVCEIGPSDPSFGWSFMRAYLPHYLKHPATGMLVPPAEWHLAFDQSVYGTLGQGVARAYLAPRGYAKSTKVSLATPLAVLALRLKEFVWLVQDTGPQARLAMASVVHELDTNRRLLGDFPHLARAYVNGRPVADRDDDIVFASGARLQALGAGMGLRGRRSGSHRPDLVLIDDLENDTHVQTLYQRDKLDAWLSSAVMGALGASADVYMVGTLLHHDAVLARLFKRDGWQATRFEAVHDETDLRTSTWPEMWPADRLEEARRRMGSLAFSREILGRPVDEESQLFPRRHFRYRPNRSRLLEASKGEISARIRIAVDPAISERRTADYSAIGVVGQIGAAREWDVLDVWRGRVSGRKLAERVKAEYDRWHAKGYPTTVLAESVQAQAWLAQALREEGIPVREVRPQRDKVLRAEPVAVLYEQGSVWHDTGLKDGEFEAEMEQFPAGLNDDQLDAVVYAISEAATRPTPRVTRL